MKNPAAVALGRKGGKATSDAKAAASKANGAKGGRPPKKLKRASAREQDGEEKAEAKMIFIFPCHGEPSKSIPKQRQR